MGLVSELRRRNVFRMAVLYVVAAWLIMQVAEVLSALLPGVLPEWFGQVTLGILAVGFPIALILSWFYEITPEGVSLEKDVEPGKSITHITGRRLDFIVISLLSSAVILFAVHTWWIAEPAERSLAVLPFENLSPTDADDYIAAGLTDTIRSALQPLNIRVVPKRTTDHAVSQTSDPADLMRTLGINNALHGSILRDGTRIRVVVELSDAISESSQWGQTYDREMSNIFGVLDDVAQNVAVQLEVELRDFKGQRRTSLDLVSTDNLAAYQSYLKGLEQQNLGEPTAADYFKQALALDPNFIEAELKLVHHYLWQLDFGAISSRRATELIIPHIDQLKVSAAGDPRVDNLDLAFFVEVRANEINALRLGFPGVEETIDDLIAAIERSPNDMSLARPLQILLSTAGRLEEKLIWANRVIEFDPYYMNSHFHRIRTLAAMDRLEESKKAAARTKAINPSVILEEMLLRDIAWQNGEFQQSLEFLKVTREKRALDPEEWVIGAINLYRLGLYEISDSYLERARSLDPDHDFVRAAELYRTMIDNDYENAAVLSLALLDDAIDNRRGAYWIAVAAYIQSMSALERLDEALATIEKLEPSVLSANFSPENVRELALHYHAVLVLSKSMSSDEAADLLDGATKKWDVSFPYWRSNPGLVASVLSARGNQDRAIELMLEELAGGIPYVRDLDHTSLYWHFFPYESLRREPEIASQIEIIEARALKAGQEILEAHRRVPIL